MLDLSRLTPDQRQAVLAGDGPLLIIAGPGSGKTTVLAARIAHLVSGRQVPPSSVLAIAFTTRATRELRTRLSGMLGEVADAVDVTTFHAFGLRIVRQWSEELGLGQGPLAVYADDEASALLREVLVELGFDPEDPALDELGRDLERHRLSGTPTQAGPHPLQRIAQAYEASLRRRGAVDYPAMLALPLQLFAARPEALRLYQDSYRSVLCDEFQDVCASQYAILLNLARWHRNLSVVGDPCQTLFTWRGADVRLLLDFQADFPEAQVVNLDQNFRSTGGLVALANALGTGLAYGRSLWTDNPPGIMAQFHIAPDEAGEAGFVAGEIERLLSEGLVNHAGEIAVLYRVNQQAHPFTVTLRERHLAYRLRGTGDLFARREVREVIAYLRLVLNPADAAALARIVNVPPRRLARLEATLRDQPVTLLELPDRAQPFGTSALASAESLVSLIEDLQRRSLGATPAQALDLAMELTGYRSWLTQQRDGPARLARLATLRALAEATACDLEGWLAELQLGEENGPAADDLERVLLTTIHGAKGGEWRVVFVVGVEEGLLPHSRSVARNTEDGARLEDELRVAYVAVTRPRERLYLTCARTRLRDTRRETRNPSRFLRGLPHALVRQAVVPDQEKPGG